MRGLLADRSLMAADRRLSASILAQLVLPVAAGPKMLDDEGRAAGRGTNRVSRSVTVHLRAWLRRGATDHHDPMRTSPSRTLSRKMVP